MHGIRSSRGSGVRRDVAGGALVQEKGAGAAAPGVLLLLTASGSRYRFDLAAGTVRRVRGTSPDLPSFVLRRDEEDIAVLDLGPVQIGCPLVMVLDLRCDGTPTVRTTNDVVAVTFADDTDWLRDGIESGRG